MADIKFDGPKEHILRTIRQAESGGGKFVYGDWKKDSDHNDRNNALAWGPFQLHPVYVEDANRFGGTHYTLEDRLDDTAAEAMTFAYLKGYGQVFAKRFGRVPTDEELYRMHNGGPRGYANPNTDRYIINAIIPAIKTLNAGKSPADADWVPPVEMPSSKDSAVIAKSEPEPAPSAVCVFKKGDSVWKIAQRHCDTPQTQASFVKAFRAANPQIADIEKIREGQPYNLPTLS